jgi:acetyltransferase-like isoleucine patch superfamily enzyme
VRLKKIIVFGSCPEDDEIAKLDHRIHYQRVNNEPLSDKINGSLKVARDYFPDAVLMTSSNTLLSLNYVEQLSGCLSPEHPVIGNGILHLIKIDSPADPIKLIKVQRKLEDQHPINPGRIILKEVLDKMDWSMFSQDKNSGLNTDGNKRLGRVLAPGKIYTYQHEDVKMLEVKGPWKNINTFEASEKKGLIINDYEGWLNWNFPGQIEQIFQNLSTGGGKMATQSGFGRVKFKTGKNFECGPYVVIDEGCEFGDNVTIGPFCHFKANTIVGSNVKIDSYVKSSGQNKIGNNVTLRYNATIAREVVVEDGCYISPNVMTNYQTADGGKQGGTVIGEGTFVGTGTVIHHGVRIAPGCKIGAMSFVNKDITEAGTYIGIPARKIK